MFLIIIVENDFTFTCFNTKLTYFLNSWFE